MEKQYCGISMLTRCVQTTFEGKVEKVGLRLRKLLVGRSSFPTASLVASEVLSEFSSFAHFAPFNLCN